MTDMTREDTPAQTDSATDASRAASNEETLQFAREAARIADDLKTAELAVLDLRGLSALADFFVIGTGTSDRQMRAVLDAIHDHARTRGRRPFSATNTTHTSWLLADYVDVVVHLFDEEHRTYYDLDGLWGDAPRVDWQGGNAQGRAQL
jgi:ribosome-associated protein